MIKGLIPESQEEYYNKMAEWSAWYSGDPMKIASVYSTAVYDPSTRLGKFWAQEITEERKTMLHIPVAGDIAEVNANLLFGEQPEVIIPEAHGENPDSDAQKTEARLKEILDGNDFDSKLNEMAETASPMSGIFLKINWKREFKPFPILRVAQPDNAVAQFQWGYLQKPTFHKVVKEDGDEVYRLLEIHYPGEIRYSLWKGTTYDLGKQIELNYLPETQHLEKPVIKLAGIDKLLSLYIPNKKPNRLWRDSEYGQSDLSGAEGLMDALDEVYTSWMRDIRLAKARITVPLDWLQRVDDSSTNSGKSFKFDIDQEVYVGLPGVDPTSREKTSAIVTQFDIRAEQHYKTAMELFERIIDTAGYSPQSFGLKIDGRADTGTALKIREKKSTNTRMKKQKYFESRLEDILETMLMVDKAVFTPGLKVYRPQVNMKDSLEDDPKQQAETLDYLNRAQAISTYMKVKKQHPEWDEDQIQTESKRILEEQGIVVSDPEIRV